MITQENIPYTTDEIKAMVKICEKYNAALERAKYALTTDMDNSGHWAVNYIFPELKESGDERMRKNLYKCLRYYVPDDIAEEYIEWLENQKEPKDKGEISTSVNVRKEKATGVLGEMIANINPESLQKTKEQMITEVEQRIKSCIGMILTDANERRFEDFFGVTLKECLEWLEKQGEQQPASVTDEWIEDYWQHEKVNNPYSYDKGEEIQFDHQGFVRFCKKYCKKPADKIEPKFHEGEWCIDKEDGTIFQIVKVLDNTYAYKTNEGKEYSCTHYSLENDAKLWTIQDAKDGDVLASGQVVFIFKAINNIWLYCHCSGHNDGTFIAESYDILRNKYFSEVHPATKEQRDLLFRSIKEAGYQWDAEKKCLTKLI